MVSEKEKKLIIGVLEMFIKNQWCITPEGIKAFIAQYGENVSIETVIAVQRAYGRKN